MSESPRLILGSTSIYRRELLARFGLPFVSIAPGVDEAADTGEGPADTVRRLARAKAMAIAARERDACVIGSDQLAELDGRPLGKPGGRDAAIAQLMSMSGRAIAFHTAVCVADRGAEVGVEVDRTVVRFRDLSVDAAARYVDAEKPFDCAGSFKSEGRGITLFDAIESADPTALVGLPLIATARLLRRAGYALP